MSQFTIKATPLEGLSIISPTESAPVEELLAGDNLASLGVEVEFVDQKVERLARGVLRGLHFQRKEAQTKLISVKSGSIYAVAVDLRPESRDFGAAYAIELSSENGSSLLIPPYFAHGFLTLERDTEVEINYSVVNEAKEESGIIWDDEILMIDWQFDRWEIDVKYLNISQRDKRLPSFRSYNANTLWINRPKVRRQR